MRVIRYTLAAALLALGGCESATDSNPPAPQPKVKVELTGAPGEMVTYAGPDGRRAECPVALTATATGKRGIAVRWQGGRMLWHFGLARTAATDTTALPEAEVVKGWNTTLIGSGATQKSQWKFYAGAPFKLTLEMDYLEEATGAVGTARHTFACGPTPPAGGAPAPVVSGVRVTPAEGDTTATTFVPGRKLKVSYEARSGLGVWESGIVVSGAFSARVPVPEAVTGLNGGRVYGSVEIMVPADAKTGQPLQVQAYALDPFMQAGSAGAPAAMQVASNVPPVLQYAYLKSSVRWPESYTRLVGRYAPGDVMDLVVRGSESRNPGWLVYTLGGAATFRDSVPVPSTSGLLEVKIPVRADWAGATRFAVHIVNDERMSSAAAVSHADSFAVVGAQGLPYRVAAFASPPTDLVLDDARGLLYLALPASGRVEVLSLATMASTRIDIQADPQGTWGMDLTRGRDTLVAALSPEGVVAVVDLARPEAPPLRVPVTVDGAKLNVQGVRVAANGSVLAWGTTSGGEKRVVEMTSSGGGQRVRADAAAAGAGAILGRSQDRSRLFFEGPGYYPCTLVYDSRTDRFGECHTVFPGGMLSSTPTGSRFARGYQVFDVATGKIRDFATTPDAKHATGLSPDGAHLYAGLADGVAKLRVSDGEYVQRFELPEPVDGRILFAGPGRLIAVSAPSPYMRGPSRVFVMDLP